MNREDELLTIISTANAELWEIRNAKTDEKNKKLIGTYWKFKNSYSSDSFWWLYIHVTHSKEGVCYGNTFQTDEGQIKVCLGDYVSGIIEESEQITEGEYIDARDVIRGEMNRFMQG